MEEMSLDPSLRHLILFYPPPLRALHRACLADGEVARHLPRRLAIQRPSGCPSMACCTRRRTSFDDGVAEADDVERVDDDLGRVQPTSTLSLEEDIYASTRFARRSTGPASKTETVLNREQKAKRRAERAKQKPGIEGSYKLSRHVPW